MYDLHATLKMEGGKMRLELVVECAYDDGNKQASMNLTTPLISTIIFIQTRAITATMNLMQCMMRMKKKICRFNSLTTIK